MSDNAPAKPTLRILALDPDNTRSSGDGAPLGTPRSGGGAPTIGTPRAVSGSSCGSSGGGSGAGNGSGGSGGSSGNSRIVSGGGGNWKNGNFGTSQGPPGSPRGTPVHIKSGGGSCIQPATSASRGDEFDGMSDLSL